MPSARLRKLIERLIGRKPELAPEVAIRAYSGEELLKVGDRSFGESLKDPLSRFDADELSRRDVLKALLVSAGAFAAGMGVNRILAASGQGRSYITAYTGVLPPSYIVFLHGGRAYAKCCLPEKAGLIEFQGTDHASVIQSSIDSLPLAVEGGRGMIFLKSGAYSLPSPVKPRSYVTLKGEGIFSTFISPSGSNNVIENYDQVNGNWFITVRDLTIGPATSGNWVGNHGIYFIKVKNSYIINCRIWYLNGKGIYLSGGWQHRILNCAISLNKEEGVYGDASVENGVYVVNSVVEQSQTTGNLRLLGGSAHHIVNSHFEGGAGVPVSLGTYYSRIVNNYIAGPTAGYGIYVAGPWNEIRGNLVRDTPDTGIVVENAKFSVIFGNIVRNAGANGIVLTGDSYEAVVIGNTIENPNNNGIGLYGESNKCVIALNELNGKNIVVATNYNLIMLNVNVGMVNDTGSGNIIKHNTGYITENSGTATIPAGSSYVDVEHGLSIPLDTVDKLSLLSIIPLDDLGGRNLYPAIHPTDPATYFRVYISNTDTVDHDFLWRYG